MKESQTLIDIKIINLFINGSDSDRETICKPYPALQLEHLRNNLLWSIMFDATENSRRTTYPVSHNGRTYKFTIVELQDDLS